MNTSEKPLSRRTFLKAAAGLVAGGLGVVACKTGESSTPPPITVKEPIPTTTTIASIPDTTSTSTTEAPTTTVAERVFASPEQKVRVEAVEENMQKFFETTKEAVVSYREKVDFTPYVSGLSTIKNYPSPDDDTYRMLGINLGTIPVQTGEVNTTLEAIGYITIQGDKFVQLYIQDVNDPELLALLPTIKTNAGANFWRSLKQEEGVATFGVDSAHQTTDTIIPEKQIVGAESLILALNSSEQVGAPVVVEYGVDYQRQFGQAGYAYEQNPKLAPIVGELNQSAKTRGLDEALSKHTSEELSQIGVITSPKIPDSLLKFGSTKQALGTLPFGGYVVFLDQAPHII